MKSASARDAQWLTYRGGMSSKRCVRFAVRSCVQLRARKSRRPCPGARADVDEVCIKNVLIVGVKRVQAEVRLPLVRIAGLCGLMSVSVSQAALCTISGWVCCTMLRPYAVFSYGVLYSYNICTIIITIIKFLRSRASAVRRPSRHRRLCPIPAHHPR